MYVKPLLHLEYYPCPFRNRRTLWTHYNANPQIQQEKVFDKKPASRRFSLQKPGFLCKYSNENMSDTWLRFIGPYTSVTIEYRKYPSAIA